MDPCRMDIVPGRMGFLNLLVPRIMIHDISLGFCDFMKLFYRSVFLSKLLNPTRIAMDQGLGS